MNKRGNSADDRLPKFFKVYLPDESGDDLELPVSFNSFLPKSLPEDVIVRSIYGNIWKMAFRKCCGDTEKFAMINGWKRIVKDEDLKDGEFLEFEFDGSRLFNFCIYGRETCKKLRSSVQTKEVRDESRGEYDISSDHITFIDDDGDIGDVNDDQDYGDEDKSSDNIIVIDDDDDNDDADNDDISDVQDYNGEDTSSKDIIVIDDDDDDNDMKNNGEEDTSSDDDQDYGDDDYANDENERKRGVKTERKEKCSFGVSKKSNNEDDRQYLDNDMNPFFTVNHNFQRKTDLRMPAKVIKHYALQFPKFIYLIDPLEKISGVLKRKVEGHTIKGFKNIISRNKVRSTDKMICELEMEMNGLVRKIKVHVIRW